MTNGQLSMGYNHGDGTNPSCPSYQPWVHNLLTQLVRHVRHQRPSTTQARFLRDARQQSNCHDKCGAAAKEMPQVALPQLWSESSIHSRKFLVSPTKHEHPEPTRIDLE